MSLELHELRERVRTILNESTAALWSDAELTSYANDGERDIAAKALCIQEVQTVTTSLYLTDYRKVQFEGYKVLYVEYVPSAGSPIGLRKISPKMLGRQSYTSLGEPHYWFQWGNWVVLDPVPYSTYTLNLYVATFPTCEMSDASDTTQLPELFYNALATYMAYRALWKDGRWAQSNMMYQSYIADVLSKRSLYIDLAVDNKSVVTQPETVEYVAKGGA